MDNNGKPNSFVFYESYYNSIESLEGYENSNEIAYQLGKIIMRYALFGEIPSEDKYNKIAISVFNSHRFNIDNAIRNRQIKSENGKKGKGKKHTKQSKAKESEIKQETIKEYNNPFDDEKMYF